MIPSYLLRSRRVALSRVLPRGAETSHIPPLPKQRPFQFPRKDRYAKSGLTRFRFFPLSLSFSLFIPIAIHACLRSSNCDNNLLAPRPKAAAALRRERVQMHASGRKILEPKYESERVTLHAAARFDTSLQQLTAAFSFVRNNYCALISRQTCVCVCVWCALDSCNARACARGEKRKDAVSTTVSPVCR